LLLVCAAATLLLSAGPAAALDPEQGIDRCAIERWAAKNGLPGDSVRTMAQATDGQLWIATFGGLARYDGIQFTLIEAPADLRLAVSDVDQMLAARDGSVWLGSLHHPPLRVQQGVVSALDRRQGLPPGQHALAYAEQAGGQIWMATEAGIYRFADGRFIPHAAAGLDGRLATALRVDDRGTLWLGTDRGLFSLVGDRLVAHPAVPGEARVSALHEDRGHVLWVAAGDSVVAIENTGSLQRLTRFSAREGLPAGPFSAITDDADGNLWIGTRFGLVRLRAGKTQLYTATDGLSDTDVASLLVDREGSLWVGSRNSGLMQVSDRTLDTRATPAVLAAHELESVCEAPDGAMWFGSRGGGAVRVKDGRSQQYGHAQGLPTDTVNAVLPGLDGEMLLGTPRGLYRWRDGRIEDVGSWPGQVIALYRDRARVLWIGGMGELGRLDPDGHLTTYGPGDGVPVRHVRHMVEDASGALWVSGVQGGLVSWQGGRFARPAIMDLVARKKGAIRSMLLDPAGVLWLAAERDGLIRIEGNQPFVHDASKGMPQSLLYQLLEDDAGDVWIGTHNSIVRVSRSSLDAVAAGQRSGVDAVSFETLDRRSGTVAAELKQPSAWKSRDGRLWFVAAQAVITIDPRRVRTNTVRPVVAVEGALVDGRPADAASDVVVPAGAHRIEVQYAARALLQPGKVRYRYRLEGVDADWVEAGTRRVAIYTDLPPGSHRFQVLASNNDGLWSDRGATSRLLVGQPFYRNYRFYLVCVAWMLPLGLIVVFLLHRMQLRRVRAEYNVMFAERNRVARELHDTLLQGMSAVGMQLHSIRGRLAGAPAETSQDLDVVQDTVAQCLEETRRVVWNLRRDGAPRGELAAALSRSAERICKPAGVACEVHVERGTGATTRVSPATEDELFRIGEEGMANAVKHAQAQRIDVHLRYGDAQVVLSVSDDGRGFDPQSAQSPGHFGLTGLRERAAKIGGTLVIRSKPGEGTTVEVTAPARAGAVR
jgi:signal transduction histidine kinase/ligand-binding sensor domain-containing protein